MQTGSEALWVGLAGRLGDRERDGPPLTLQYEDWVSVEFFVDVCVPPHHITAWVKNPPKPTQENRSA